MRAPSTILPRSWTISTPASASKRTRPSPRALLGTLACPPTTISRQPPLRRKFRRRKLQVSQDASAPLRPPSPARCCPPAANLWLSVCLTMCVLDPAGSDGAPPPPSLPTPTVLPFLDRGAGFSANALGTSLSGHAPLHASPSAGQQHLPTISSRGGGPVGGHLGPSLHDSAVPGEAGPALHDSAVSGEACTSSPVRAFLVDLVASQGGNALSPAQLSSAPSISLWAVGTYG